MHKYIQKGETLGSTSPSESTNEQRQTKIRGNMEGNHRQEKKNIHKGIRRKVFFGGVFKALTVVAFDSEVHFHHQHL